MNKKKSAPWLQALHAVMPLCISYIPVGLACGVLLQKVGFDPLLSGLLSILVFSGGAQFLVANDAYDASIICNDIIDGFLFRITLYIIRSKYCRFYEKRKADVFGCLFSITE